MRYFNKLTDKCELAILQQGYRYMHQAARCELR